MLNVPRLSPRKQPKTKLYDVFRLGVCTRGDPTEIKQLRDAQNAVFDRFGFKARKGITKKGGSIGAVKVTGLAEAEALDKTYFFAVCARILKKWNYTDGDVAWSNTDKTALTTTLDTYIKSFPCISATASITGTATADSTTRTLIDTGKSWTVDAYIGYAVKLLTGTGAGQSKLIVANDATKLYVKEPFDTAPDATTTYEIFTIADQAVVTNGTDTTFKYNGTSSSNLTVPKNFDDIEVHDDRLWGAEGNNVYFSDEVIGDQFSQTNLVPYVKGDGNIRRVQGLGEQLIVYKKNSFAVISGNNGVYGIKERSKSVGLYAKNSLATGAEMQFFLSERGVEVVNRYEYDITAAVTPISENIKDWLDEHSAAELQAACGMVYDNYYYLFIADSGTYYTYRYDILRSDFANPDPDSQIWDRLKGWPANICAILAGNLSFGTVDLGANNYVYTAFLGGDDDGTDIDLVVQTRDDDFSSQYSTFVDIDKEFDKVFVVAKRSTVAITYTVEYRLDVDSAWDTLGTFNTKSSVDIYPAKGTMTLTGLPTAAESFVLNATTITAVASGASTDEFNIGATADETANNIMDAVNVSSESANIFAYKNGSGVVVFEWIDKDLDGDVIVFTEAMANTTVDGAGTLTRVAQGREKVEFNLYKRGKTIAFKITRSDDVDKTQGEIIKLLVHYHLDQRE